MGESRTADIDLTCQPNRADHKLIFPYRLDNRGGVDVHVMDASPRVDAASGETFANDQAAVVILHADGEATIGKYPAPLPTDRRIAAPVPPLVRLLAAGESLTGDLRLAMPLAETGPYSPDLRLREYELTELQAVVFRISYWLVGAPGLLVAAPDYTDEYQLLMFRRNGPPAAHVSRRYPTRGLQILRRTDAFPRTV